MQIYRQISMKSHHLRIFHQTSNIRRTKYKNFNDSRPALQLYLPNPPKPGAKSRIKM